MRGVSFLSSFRSVEAFNSAVEAVQRNSAYFAAEIQVRMAVDQGKIVLLDSDDLYAAIAQELAVLKQARFFAEPKQIKSFYRDEELTEGAVKEGFKGARDLMDVMRESLKLFINIKSPKDAEPLLWEWGVGPLVTY